MMPEPEAGTVAPAEPPATPPRRFPVAIVVSLLLALLLVGGAASVMFYIRWAKRPEATTGAPVRVTVPTGATPASVAQELEAKHLIRSARIFTMVAKGTVIHPGIYDIAPTESPTRILGRLAKGDVVTVRVTFPEGFTVRQMAKRLARNGLCSETAFYDLVTRRGNTLKASFPPPANLEGYLFPDTYRFPLGESETQIAQRMLGDFDTLVARNHTTEIGQSGHTLAEIVTVASLIEREAEVEQDRPLIAGVIYNRLQRGMHLQIDATVQYVLPEHKARLRFRDLKVDSPYNTYKVSGLPPGPICCPGMPSIAAALRPATHDYLYYVARSDGSHVFGKTYAEHTHNIATVRHAR